jgi:hypothetical protein
MEAALRIVTELDVEIAVDDWAYALMVKDGVAPAIRPASVLTAATMDYPGTGSPRGPDDRQVSVEALGHAPDFLGLTADAAIALASEKGISVRVPTVESGLVTLDYDPARLNLQMADGRVVSASAG